MLVTVLDRTRAESARATDELARTRADARQRAGTSENAPLRAELEAARARLAEAEGTGAELTALRTGARADPQPRRRHAPSRSRRSTSRPLAHAKPMERRRAPGDASTSTACGIPIRSQLDPAYVARPGRLRRAEDAARGARVPRRRHAEDRRPRRAEHRRRVFPGPPGRDRAAHRPRRAGAASWNGCSIWRSASNPLGPGERRRRIAPLARAAGSF